MRSGPALLVVLLASLACASASPPPPPPEPWIPRVAYVPAAPEPPEPEPAPEPPRAPRPPPDAIEPEPAPEPVAPSKPPKAGKPPAPKPKGIAKTGERTWTVTRALADRWHEDPYRLGDAREAGDGWELTAVRQRHAYHLGMHNGDVVLTVNGHRLGNKAQLLAAYLACRNDRSFDVLFVRDGRRMVHHYEIVER